MHHVLNRAAAKLALAAWAVLAAVQAHADPIGAYESHAPAIAFDTANDRGLVVFESGGRIYGRFVNNSGGVAGSEFPILPTQPLHRAAIPRVCDVWSALVRNPW